MARVREMNNEEDGSLSNPSHILCSSMSSSSYSSRKRVAAMRPRMDLAEAKKRASELAQEKVNLQKEMEERFQMFQDHFLGMFSSYLNHEISQLERHENNMEKDQSNTDLHGLLDEWQMVESQVREKINKLNNMLSGPIPRY